MLKREPARITEERTILKMGETLFAIGSSTKVEHITYIKTHEGWSYLAVVIDLFSRRVVGWSMQSRMTTDLALQALLSAVWRRKPKTKVMVHSPSRALLRNTLPVSGPRFAIHQQRVAVVSCKMQSCCQHEQA